ncbi:hypothetical protein M407DRAFT_24284 [Tulasnella calospora MUT 4182]|uniref:NmrA-like domain-containing protein n=1 Tax=Tulasnella calospora MUT 4182 TaxID=1051891 RepID=A0A0C3Q926_9AGAM|nr:hypothetical protein M407DRAFT_24284 [Tulasnella calospora MUT 4182]
MTINVAIAGATGHLGPYVVRAFLEPSIHPLQVKRVVAFTRNATSDSAKDLETRGAEVIEGAPTVQDLKGIDVFINVLSDKVSVDVRDTYAQAAAEAGVKVYFPNEFVADARLLDFEHPLYKMKVTHAKRARELGSGKMKVVSVYSGQFLDYLFWGGAMIGLDTVNRTYTVSGLPANKFGITSMADVGTALARFSILAAENPASVPDHVRLSGDAVSFAELATVVGNERGETIEVKSTSAAETKQKLIDNPADFLSLVRYMLGSGVTDFSKENENELVNPGQSLWRWRTVADAVKENKGVHRPPPTN